MHFSPAFVIAALPFLVAASPSPGPFVTHGTGRMGISIPLSKRSNQRGENGVANLDKLKAHMHNAIVYVSILPPWSRGQPDASSHQ